MSGFWIRTEPTIDGKAFIVTLSFSDDHSVTLTPTRASAYGNALLAAVADAEYDHAILRQMSEKLGLPDHVAMQVVVDLRKERPTREAGGLRFNPGISQRKRHPFITVVGSDGVEYGQLDADAARRHALHVLEAPPAADLDAAYLKVLRSLVGIDENKARQVVEDIGNFRQPWAVSDS